MEKTIRAFLQFIVDDPIMLGLCIAIAILSVLFVIIFVIGKVADKKEKSLENKEEKLLKTEVDLSVLSESKESEEKVEERFTISDDAKEIPVVIEENPFKLDVEVPSTTGEVPLVENEPTLEQVAVEPAIQEESQPGVSVPSFDDFRIEVSTENEIKEITQELNVVPERTLEKSESTSFYEENPNVDDYTLDITTPEDVSDGGEAGVIAPINFVEETPVEEETEENVFDVPAIEPVPVETESKSVAWEPITFDESDYATYSEPQVVESTVNPVDESSDSHEEEVSSIPSYEQQLVEDYGFTDFTSDVLPYNTQEIELPMVEEEVKPAEVIVEPIKQEDSLEDTYSYEEPELPEINVEDFSRTALIRHIPVLDSRLMSMFDDDDDSSDEDDDLDLPKLNSTNSGMFNNLKGESFDITKNS